MSGPLIRPLTYDDVIAYRGRAYPNACHGVVAEKNGKILGISGILYTDPMQAFAEFDDEMKRYPRSIMRAIYAVMRILKQYPGPIYAIRSKKHNGAHRVLDYAGFEKIDGDLYRWVR